MNIKKIGILLCAGSKLGNIGKSRANIAKKELLSRNIDLVIICGGFTSKKSEASTYYEYLIKLGIPSNRIIKEESSKDTIGNAAFSKKIIEQLDLPTNITLITSKSHMKRAKMIFDHIFGEQYTIQTKSSIEPFSLLQRINEIKLFTAESILLQTIPRADTNGTIEFIMNNLPQYQSK